MPLVYGVGLTAIGLLTAVPWRQQTPWAMVCVTLLSCAALLLAHWDDNPDYEDDGDDG